MARPGGRPAGRPSLKPLGHVVRSPLVLPGIMPHGRYYALVLRYRAQLVERLHQKRGKARPAPASRRPSMHPPVGHPQVELHGREVAAVVC
jgi:hypothetical protein